MIDALAGAMGVLISLGVALGMLRLMWDRPMDARGMVGLGATVVHLLLSLLLPALTWAALNPSKPLVFVLSVLVFYWISLIILVVTIIRWLRGKTGP